MQFFDVLSVRPLRIGRARCAFRGVPSLRLSRCSGFSDCLRRTPFCSHCTAYRFAGLRVAGHAMANSHAISRIQTSCTVAGWDLHPSWTDTPDSNRSCGSGFLECIGVWGFADLMLVHIPTVLVRLVLTPFYASPIPPPQRDYSCRTSVPMPYLVHLP